MLEIDRKTVEALDILQEEAAEVISVVSKLRRFGLDGFHPFNLPKKTNRTHLIEELGDISAVIEIVQGRLNISNEELAQAKQAKIEKLKKWTNIF